MEPIQPELAAEPNGQLDYVSDSPETMQGPMRRCLVGGDVLPLTAMVRFVVGPNNMVVPDFSARLPGRGLWLRASRDIVNTAVARKLFARAARKPVATSPDLSNMIESALAQRSINLVGLARRAGQAFFGLVKVRTWLKAGKRGVLLLAVDGSLSERSRMRRLAADVPVIEIFSSSELGAVFGRDYAVHAVIAPGGLARHLEVECGRLGGFRPEISDGDTGGRVGEIMERDCDE
ncbi:MAG: RNA-binding protein [Rhodospirillales bacterium]